VKQKNQIYQNLSLDSKRPNGTT